MTAADLGSPGWLEERRRRHDALLADRVRADRAALAAELAPPRSAAAPLTDDELRRLTAAKARLVVDAPLPSARALEPVGAVLSRAERRAGSAQHAKLHASDWRPLPRIPEGAFGAAQRLRARVRSARAKGDPSRPSLMRTVDALQAAWSAGGNGAEWTFARIAGFGCICVDTARKSVRWLEEHAGLEVLGQTVWREIGGIRRHVRGANRYLAPRSAPIDREPAPPEPAPPRPAPRPEPATCFERAARTAARWLPLLPLTLPGGRHTVPAPDSG